MNAGNFGVAEFIVQPQRSVGGHGDLIVHRIGSAAADANGWQIGPGVRVDGAYVHPIARFAHFDLDFLRKVFSVGAVSILHPDFRGNFQFAAGIAMDAHFAKAVIEAQALIAGQRNGLFEIARDLLLSGLFPESRRACRAKQNGKTEPGLATRRVQK